MFFYNPWVRKWGLLLPPPTGRSPSLEEGGLGIGKARVSGTSAGARCANSFHRCGGPPPSRREVFGVENRRSVECRREIATVRCVCNAGLHHCNGQMYLQPSVAPPSPVGARIARPFVPDVIITLRAPSRRVVVITSGKNGRAMRAPTGYGDAAVGCKCI